jgi:cytochrome o ubiquinol oxidase subunit 2
MTFTAKSTSEEDFEEWVQSVKQSPKNLGTIEYQCLLQPSEYDPVSYYVLAEPCLFDQIIMKYMMPPP